MDRRGARGGAGRWTEADADAEFEAEMLALRRYMTARLEEDEEEWEDEDEYDDDDDEYYDEDEPEPAPAPAPAPAPREEPRYTATVFDPSIHSFYFTGRGGLGGLGLRTRDSDPDERFDYTGYEQGTSFRAPRVPVKWRFLRPFLNRFETPLFAIHEPERVHTDAVRVGRDADDWWLDVKFNNAEPPTKRTKYYGSVRASMLLHAMLARADYDGFLALLIRRSRLDVPPTMNLTAPTARLAPVFHFRFDGDEKRSLEHSWYTLMHLFEERDGGADHDFVKLFLKLVETVVMDPNVEDGWKEKVLAPVPIKFTVAPDFYELKDQPDMIASVAQTVSRIRACENDWREHLRTEVMRSDDVLAPVFHLESIDLDLRKFTLHSSVLIALEKLLATGVHVSSLTLPELAANDGNDATKCRIA